MGLDWNFYKLDELINLRTGKLDSNAEEANGDYPFFTCAPDPLKINSYSFDQKAILLAGNNANGNFHINYYEGKFDAYQRTYVIDVLNEEKIDLKFLYYALKICLRDFKRMSQGTSTRFLTKRILDNFEIQVPPIETQLKIVEVLDSISNKIIVNQQINKNLHQQRKLLFKHWFIDFDLFSSYEMKDTTFGLIPKSWEIYDFKEILTKRTEKSNDDSIPMFSVTNTGIHPREDKFNKKLAASTSKFKLIYKNDLVFGMSREILNWGLMEEQIGGVSSAYHIFKINEKKVNPFYLKSFIENYMPYFKDIIKPASREGQGIDQNILMIKQIYVPPDNIFKEFYQIDMNYNNLININNTEIERLTQLRNMLLPKLMSGEIDVSKINCE